MLIEMYRTLHIEIHKNLQEGIVNYWHSLYKLVGINKIQNTLNILLIAFIGFLPYSSLRKKYFIRSYSKSLMEFI